MPLELTPEQAELWNMLKSGVDWREFPYRATAPLKKGRDSSE